jgi:hypothetical protein
VPSRNPSILVNCGSRHPGAIPRSGTRIAAVHPATVFSEYGRLSDRVSDRRRRGGDPFVARGSAR